MAASRSIRGWGGAVPTPDGGATVMLLGAALGSLGMARRFLKQVSQSHKSFPTQEWPFLFGRPLFLYC